MRIKKLMRSVLATVLATSMTLSTCMTALAAPAEDNTIKYVSLGASNVNGYGMDGYYPNGNEKENVYGYKRIVDKAYPVLFANALEEQGYDVEVTQLGISSFRAEEVHVMLDDDYDGDGYTDWRFHDGGQEWFKAAAKADGSYSGKAVDHLRDEFQSAITDADVVTIDVGMNNFGVFICQRMFDMMSGEIPSFGADLDKNSTEWLEHKDEILAMKAEIDEYMKVYCTKHYGGANIDIFNMGNDELDALMNFLVQTIQYTYLGFATNFDASMAHIYEMNPDVDVVAVGMYNTMTGLTIDYEVNGFVLPAGDIIEIVLKHANNYIKELSPYAECYTYVDSIGRHNFFHQFETGVEDNSTLYNNLSDECKRVMYEYAREEAIRNTGYDIPENNLLMADIFTQIFAKALSEPKLNISSLKRMNIDAFTKSMGECVTNALFNDNLDLSFLDRDSDYVQTDENGNPLLDENGRLINDCPSMGFFWCRFFFENWFNVHPDEQGHSEAAKAIMTAYENAFLGDNAEAYHEAVMKILCEKCAAEGHKDKVTATWKWAPDYSSATAELTCSLCGSLGNEPATAAVTSETTVEAKCLTDGEKVYTAKVELSGEEFTDTKVEVIKAKGAHTYGEAKFDWTQDKDGKYTGATVSVTCTNTNCDKDATSTLKEDAEVTASADTAVCTEGGEIVYTATATINGKEVDNSQKIVTKAKGHSYGTVEFTWAADYSSATAAKKCLVEGCSEDSANHSVPYKVTMGEPVVIPATCTENAYTTYVATADVDGEDVTDTKVVEDENSATGHNCTPEWTWAEDYSTATVTFTCGNEGCDHTETLEAEVTSEEKDSTCTVAGKTVYTAKVTHEGKEVTDAKTVDKDVLGHDYKVEWTWTEDYKDASVNITCGNEDCDYKETVEAKVVISETTEAKCTVDGRVVYTATAEFNEKEFTDVQITVIEKTGHDYEDDICKNCGEKDPDSRPDAAGECNKTEAAELKSGATLNLALGGTEVGTYTFEETSEGWTIKTADGKYVALVDGVIGYSDSPFAWKYANGNFSTNVTTKSSSSSNWFGNILGGILGGIFGKTETITYYLVAGENGLTVSTKAGSGATFTTTVSAESHTYGEGVKVEESCTEGGYTGFTCEVCGHVAKMNETSALGHDYTSEIVLPECTEAGYTLHTCGNCGDSYKDNETKATGHDFGEDGICKNCGTPEEIQVEVDKEVSLTAGTYELRLGGKSVGTFTFAKSGNGWTIQAADGKYVALDDGELVYSDSAFTWTFSNGKFSATEKSGSSNWLGNILGGILGGIFGSSSKTYYLVADGNELAVSTSSSSAKATFFTKEMQTVKPGETPDTPSEPEEPSKPDQPSEPEKPGTGSGSGSGSSSSSWLEKLFGGLFGKLFG